MPCKVCDNTGWVCEEHPGRPSDCGGSKRGCTCGARAVPQAFRALTAMSRRQASVHECQPASWRTATPTTTRSTKPRNAAPPLPAAVDRRGN